MITVEDYYKTTHKTSANSKDFELVEQDFDVFPKEGIYIGEFESLKGDRLPALIPLDQTNGVCFLTTPDNEKEVKQVMQMMVLRLACSMPSEKCRMILYDGEGRGSELILLSELSDLIKGEKIIDRPDTLKEKLKAVDEEMSHTVQALQLGYKYKTHVEYDMAGGEKSLPYTFVVIADFPQTLDMETSELLLRIVKNGRKAGVFVLMNLDTSTGLIPEKNETNFIDQKPFLDLMTIVYRPSKGEKYYIKNFAPNLFDQKLLNRFALHLDSKKPDNLDDVIRYINKNASPSIIKQDYEQLENTSYEPVFSEISVTIGLDVKDKHPVTFKLAPTKYLHGFILGQSGSGKSVLLNTIISSLILKYSPQDLMLYLMDFKGAEFNRYRGLKHTKAVLVDANDPQMTLEVLTELYDEYKRRMDVFIEEGFRDIDRYNKKHPENRLPQILFVADECQEMLKDYASVSSAREVQRDITSILGQLASLGRAAGIHLLFATQQLDGVDLPGKITANLTECFLLKSEPIDSKTLVPDSGDLSKQSEGVACYYHSKMLVSQVRTFFSDDDELASAIEAAHNKAKDFPSNGGHYFCGTSLYYLDQNKELIEHSALDCPIALIGQNIGINAGATVIPLRKDFYEHILIWGVNKEEQATAVLMNALISLMMSCRSRGIDCQFLVIDCERMTNSRYKVVLAHLAEKGYCRLIERQNSGSVLKDLVSDVKNDRATPTVLAIIGSERFVEIKYKKPLDKVGGQSQLVTDDGVIGFDMDSLSDLMGDESTDPDVNDFPKALKYLLEEGAVNDVHVLMQIDKPSNILFGDNEYDIEAAIKFRHKVILRSENKYLNPFRFSKDIDVEVLSDEVKRMRAYYYPEDDDPVLFTPYQMPDAKIIYSK